MRQRGFGLIVYAVLALAILGTLAGIGYSIRKAGMDAVRVEWDAAVEDQRERDRMASLNAAKDLQVARDKRQIVVREVIAYVDKIIDRPIYRNMCLDADGLRCVRSAILGKSAAGCKPDKPLPGATGTGRWDGGIDLALDYRIGGSLP